MIDADTWATPAITFAPKNLTTAQLVAIYSCKFTLWNQVGGKRGLIRPFLPGIGTDKREAFLREIGLRKPGPCVSDANGTLRENFGASKLLASPDAIVPYSVADYIAQRYHSAKCLIKTCTAPPSAQRICTPGKGRTCSAVTRTAPWC